VQQAEMMTGKNCCQRKLSMNQNDYRGLTEKACDVWGDDEKIISRQDCDDGHYYLPRNYIATNANKKYTVRAPFGNSLLEASREVAKHRDERE
jgi:hypothetical protein